MNKRVRRSKEEFAVMAGKGMRHGRVITVAEKQPLAFPHLLCITFVHKSPSYSPDDVLDLYFTATTDKITDLPKLEEVHTVKHS
jgi:hypothetical protein